MYPFPNSYLLDVHHVTDIGLRANNMLVNELSTGA